MAAISATCHHTAPHCGWAQSASFAVRSVWPAATARWRRDVVDVLVEVGSWLLHMPVSALCARSSVCSARTDPFLGLRRWLAVELAVSWPAGRAGVPPPQISALWQCQSSDGRSASFECAVASKKISNFHVLRRSLKDAEDLADSAGVAQGGIPGASPGCSGASYSNCLLAGLLQAVMPAGL